MEVEKRKRVIKDLSHEDQVENEEEEEAGEGERVNMKMKESEKGCGSGDGDDDSSGDHDGVVVPTEEEVDEFFAILKRMKVAVKYFDEKRNSGGGREWRKALETAQITVPVEEGVVVDIDDHDDNNNGGGGVLKREVDRVTGILDLNAVAPEAAESGGA